jgi:hypothetical protein
VLAVALAAAVVVVLAVIEQHQDFLFLLVFL